MHIGIFGGTFNPIHLGHLRAAQEVKAAFALDTIYIIPSAIPPHKGNLDLVTANDRLEMIRRAVSDHPGLVVSDIELKRPGPSYTIDTVNHFISIFSQDTRLYLIMGLDAFVEIDTWKSYNDLLKRIPFIVMARPDAQWKEAGQAWQTLEKFLKRRISNSYVFSESRSGYFHANKKPIYISNLNLLDISSSAIRQFIKAGKSIRSLVPPAVASYIKSRGLYL
jgi:nicotinate-nucleotide adenylyltransferase